MSRDIMAGQWNQLKGKVKQTWGKLTDDEILESQGNMDMLVGKIQEKYGGTKEEIRQRLNEMLS